MLIPQCLSKNIFLADDDEDDRLFFEEALKEVCNDAILTVAEDGDELMEILYRPPVPMPDVIFLDLNMPKKNGFECLAEIKNNRNLKNLPIIIFTTSLQEESVRKVYNQGANYYVRKPTDYRQLKLVVKKILAIDWLKEVLQPEKERFIFTA
ncbi:response regulator [uncultured Flavobacterium sp.]|uniref:response regulator n=1 Tax=uncultured Flavobacterium sp. TaxID=165435 RepID=UPI002600051C|nr:response regulator [uncultured Flavobacterium sp.]